jgi:hypothetical protein
MEGSGDSMVFGTNLTDVEINLLDKWNDGHASVPIRRTSGIHFGSNLRIGVGDGTGDVNDWTLFYFSMGNGGHDFYGSKTYSFGSEAVMNPGLSDEISAIYGFNKYQITHDHEYTVIPGVAIENNAIYQSNAKILYKNPTGHWFVQSRSKDAKTNNLEQYLIQEPTDDGCPGVNGWKKMTQEGTWEDAEQITAECLDIVEWGEWSSWACPTHECYPHSYRTRSCFRGGSQPFHNDHCQEPGQLGVREDSNRRCDNACWSTWSDWGTCKCDRSVPIKKRSRICNCSKVLWKPSETEEDECKDECGECLATDGFAYNCIEETYVPLIQLKRGDLVKSFDFLENKYVCVKVVASHRHKYPGDFVKVTLNNGAHFSLTPRHMLYRKIDVNEIGDHIYEKVIASDLKIGDMVQIDQGKGDLALIVHLKIEKKMPIAPQTLNTVIVVNNVTLSTLTIGDAKYGNGLVQLFDTLYDGITFEEGSNGEPGKRADRLFGELVVATRELVRMDNFEANEVGKIVMKTVEKYKGKFNSNNFIKQLEDVKEDAQT